MSLRQHVHGSIRKASSRFRTWNRARKAMWLEQYARRHDVRSVLLVGAGGDAESWENHVERSAAASARLAVWCGTEARTGLDNYVVCDGRALPFRSGAFDLVFSNAVVEHVGGAADQRRFVAEHDRVGRWWAATTPNRWFPVESHTLTPLRHWSASWRERRPEFTRLLSRGEFADVLPPEAAVHGSPLSPTFTGFRDRADARGARPVR